MRRLATFIFVCFASFASVAAQDVATRSLFGDEVQPGNRLHENVIELVNSGNTSVQAIAMAIASSMTEEDTTLNPDAKSAIAFNVPLSNDFYREMIVVNSLIDVTKVLIEEYPAKVIEVITLGVVLYPDFAQEVLDGAALTGAITPENALVAALQAGADPSLVSTATAAGVISTGPISPVGIGIGAGGAGGGDTTVSSN
ncbi:MULTISPECIES: hypothetical protein [Alteromonadaceae]|uniref:Uncharacterized protein n=1 Tax=Brumicola blandensis TaxID=3075611 RepID=A0AAW8R5V5_9ALTE|nr:MULTISPECIES: hypothetical protein [unclassified Alteromonas]MDT0584074.1 hypothetical protein [Alteromonas sp. W409]MDT0628987.1 hypothetical protein [Alteromonas sp. W364]